MLQGADEYAAKQGHIELMQRMQKVCIPLHSTAYPPLLRFYPVPRPSQSGASSLGSLVWFAPQSSVPVSSLILCSQRDAGSAPTMGDRVPYVMIKVLRSIGSLPSAP